MVAAVNLWIWGPARYSVREELPTCEVDISRNMPDRLAYYTAIGMTDPRIDEVIPCWEVLEN